MRGLQGGLDVVWWLWHPRYQVRLIFNGLFVSSICERLTCGFEDMIALPSLVRAACRARWVHAMLARALTATRLRPMADHACRHSDSLDLHTDRTEPC